MLIPIPIDQKRLPRGRRRLPRPSRPRRVPRQGQAHLPLRRLPPRLLQPFLGDVRDGLQHRHGLLGSRPRGTTQAAVRDCHRQAQAVLLALLGRPAPARRLVRAALRLGGQDGRPDAQPPLQGGVRGGRRPVGRKGHLPPVPAVHQGA